MPLSTIKNTLILEEDWISYRLLKEIENSHKYLNPGRVLERKEADTVWG